MHEEPKNSDMPGSDSLAVVTLDNAKITAMDEETWDEAVAAIGATAVQAAFTLKLKDDTTLVWMGYSGGEWLELSGVTPTEDHQWDVKIEFDYSLGANARKIRYLIRPAVNENNENVDYTPLTHGGSDWIAIGVEKAVIAGVDLYGFGTADAAAAASGARPASGTASGVAECSMDYSDLKLTVTRSSSDADTWADQIQVVVKKNGATLGTATAELPATGKSAVIDLTKAQDLANKVVPGETYDYDVFFAKTYGGETQKTAIAGASGTINMFSAIDWFGFNGKEFVNAKTTNITVEGDKFGATDDEQKGAINPDKAADEGQQTIVTSELVVASAYPWDELAAASDVNTQFAVALAIDGGTRVWAYYDPAQETWVKDQAGIATADGTYTGVATFDYRGDTKTVTYTIKYDGVTKTLASGVSLGDNTKLNGVDIMGNGFGKMNALCKTTGAAPVAPKDGTITLESNSKVDLTNLDGAYTVESAAGKSFHLRWDDAGNKYAKMQNGKLVVTTGTPANGISSFLNYAFGLDRSDTDPTDLPVAVVKPGVAQTDGFEVYVPNVNPPADSGYTVYFQIQRKLGNGAWENFGSEVKAGSGQLKIPLTDAANPYLYRVKTLIR